MTHQDYQDTTDRVQDILDAFTGTDRADFAGCILRMAGHDLMDFDPNAPAGQAGGSDGCVDFNDGDNAGLASCLQLLQPAYEFACATVSLADFLVIAGEAVMEGTSGTNIGFQNQFQYGRTTNAGCAWAIGRLPNPEFGCDNVPNSVKTVFVDAMGLSWNESAALMGVHTLGRADPANSGYDGWWSEPTQQGIFNNDYFKAIIDKGWKKETQSNPNKRQWIRSDVALDPNNLEMMLTSDMCLSYSSTALLAANDNCCAWSHFGQNDPPSLPHCGSMNAPSTNNGNTFGQDLNNCCDLQPIGPGCVNPSNPGGPAFDKVNEYAGDNQLFLNEFKAVWTKVTENGFNGVLTPLHTSCDGVPTHPPTKMPTASPTVAQTEAPTPSPSSGGGCCEATEQGLGNNFDCSISGLQNQPKCDSTNGDCAWNPGCGGCCVATPGAIRSGMGGNCGMLDVHSCIGDICMWDPSCTEAPTPAPVPTHEPTVDPVSTCCIGETAASNSQCATWWSGFVASLSQMPAGSVDWEGRCNENNQLACQWDSANCGSGTPPPTPAGPGCCLTTETGLANNFDCSHAGFQNTDKCHSAAPNCAWSTDCNPTTAPTTPPTLAPTPGPPTCWTPWFDRDQPGGTGDWESFSALSQEHPQAFLDAGCSLEYTGQISTPLGVQCQDAQSGQDWSQFNDNFANGEACSPSEGIVCVNRDQPYGTCHDYKVRFNCCEQNRGTSLGGVLTFSEHNDKCTMTMQGGKVISTCEVKAPNGRSLEASVASLQKGLQTVEADVATLKGQMQNVLNSPSSSGSLGSGTAVSNSVDHAVRSTVSHIPK
jgi:hypothetical protein